MKKLLLVIMMISFSFLLLACGTNQQTSSSGEGNIEEEQKDENETKPWTDGVKSMEMEGYVVKNDSRTVLVTPHPQNKQPNSAPAYFSNVPDKLHIGDRVKISFNIMKESYPGQAEALDVKVLDAHKPAGADLTEAQVLNKALNNSQIKTPILSTFHYDKKTDTWKIVVDNSMGETKDITIEDK
jgi:hypothetical protein